MKRSGYLQRVRRDVDRQLMEARSIHTQMCLDAAMIAAHDVLQLGPGRAEDFCVAYRDAINDMARRVVDDQMDDPEFVYAKAKIDEQVRAIVGEDKFQPWEVRYGEKSV